MENLKGATCRREPGDWDHDSSKDKEREKKSESQWKLGNPAQAFLWPLAFSWRISSDNVASLASFNLPIKKELQGN